MATGQFTKKAVDIEALMAQAAALEQEEAAKKEKPEKQKPKKKEKAPRVKKVKAPKKKKEKEKGVAKKVFGIPLHEVEIDEDEEMPLIWVTLISVLESYGKLINITKEITKYN